MLKDILITAREHGLFAKLPLTKECLMYVDDHGEALYCWPLADDIPDEGNVN